MVQCIPTCTIHPFVIYCLQHDENSQSNFDSFVLISKCTNHDNVSVHLFQKKLINWLIEKRGKENVKKVYYFSDCAASQYKNKENLINLTHHFEDFSIEVEWNFFATSFEKNACDRIGGTVKRFVRRESLRRPDIEPIATPKA